MGGVTGFNSEANFKLRVMRTNFLARLSYIVFSDLFT